MEMQGQRELTHLSTRGCRNPIPCFELFSRFAHSRPSTASIGPLCMAASCKGSAVSRATSGRLVGNTVQEGCILTHIRYT